MGKCCLPAEGKQPAFYLLLPQQDGVATSSPSIDPVAPQRTQPRGRSSGLGQLLRLSGFVGASWLQSCHVARRGPGLRSGRGPGALTPQERVPPGLGTVSSTGSRQAVFPSCGTSVHTDSDRPRASLSGCIAETSRGKGSCQGCPRACALHAFSLPYVSSS